MLHTCIVVRKRNNSLHMRMNVRICNTFDTYSYVLHMHTHSASIACSAFLPQDQSDGPKSHLGSHSTLISLGHLHKETGDT